MAFSAFGGPEVLHPIEIAEPAAGPGEVRVRVRAAGVAPLDCKIRGGMFAGTRPATFPHRLGNEFAGIVDQIGDGVTGFEVGAEVLGFTVTQAYAEVIAVSADQVTAKPAALAWEVAGGLSVVGQGAYHYLRELGVRAGETLLIHAAAGGLGTMAVQLARRSGATVIGTASERNHEYLRSLGAIPVRYGDGLIDRIRAAAPGGVDAALDAIGGEATGISVELVADRSRVATLVDMDSSTEKYGIRRLVGGRSAEVLGELADLAARGELQLPIRTFPLADAVAAHRQVESGHGRGKVVLTVG
jgi:enoyl reductase